MKVVDRARSVASAGLAAVFVSAAMAILVSACEPEPTDTPESDGGASSRFGADAPGDGDDGSDSEPGTVSGTDDFETAETPAAEVPGSDSERGGDSNAELTPLTVMLDWVPNTNHAGLYLALDEGAYEAEGLEVEIIQPGEVFAEQAVAAGIADIGVSYQEALTLARAGGVPLVSIAAIIQHNTSGFASLESLGVESATDFEGLRYGSFGSPFESPTLNGLMTCAAAAEGQLADVDALEIVEIGFSEPLPLMQTGRIDLAWIFEGWQAIQAQREGMGLGIIRMSDHFDCIPDYYTPILVASEQTIAERPEVLRAFLAAVTAGYAGAIDRPADAAAALLNAAPELDPGLVEESMEWLAPRYAADAPRWGEQRLAVWSDYALWLEANGVIDSDFDPAAAFTSVFLPSR